MDAPEDTREDAQHARRALVALLRAAHAGEIAAARAYHGHARSVVEPSQRDEITRIEEEEVDHRVRVARILERLGEPSSRRRDRVLAVVGSVIALMCRVGRFLPRLGWFAAMYGAGLLESRNIFEYVHAARHAERAGFPEFVPDLLDMAAVEAEHERTFRGYCRQDRLLCRLIPLWAEPSTAWTGEPAGVLEPIGGDR